MSQLNKSDLNDKYNNSGTGRFKTGQARGIGSDDFREMMDDHRDSHFNLIDHAFSGAAGTKPGISTIANLKSLLTTDKSVGIYVQFRDTGSADALRVYELVAGTDAEVSPDIIRPNDYAASTNEKVWKLAAVSTSASVQSVTGDGVDNTDPDNPIIELTASRTVTGTDSIVQTDSLKTIYFNSGSPFNFTIDQLTVNSETAFVNIGAGVVTFVAGAGVTISGVTSLPGSENTTAVILYRTATNPVIVSGGGSGVETVTGDGVNNTDPDNPVLIFPTPTEIGLGNVDNTSDANKPISNAQAAEFTRIENLIGKSDLGSAM